MQDVVEEKLKTVESNDKLRNFKPVITGQLILESFDLKPGKIIGDMKTEIREAILDGIIQNNLEDAIPMMHKIAKRLNLTVK